MLYLTSICLYIHLTEECKQSEIMKATHLFLYLHWFHFKWHRRSTPAGLDSPRPAFFHCCPFLTSIRHKPGLCPWALGKSREGLQIFNLVDGDFVRPGWSPHLVCPGRMTTDRVPSGRDLKSFHSRRSNFLIAGAISWSCTDYTLESSKHVPWKLWMPL